MDERIVQQIVDELLSSLEPLETQNAALLQFLKAKGLATDEELAPFLEQAANTSNVRWRAVRVRTAALISSAMKPAEQSVETASAKNTQSPAEPSAEAKQEIPPEEKSHREEQSADDANKNDEANKNKEQPGIPPQPSQQTEQNSKPAKSAPEDEETKQNPNQKAA